ncbi:ATP-binding protein [Sabulilitoribacter arenilitoris]|uniref:histidine kinase n=1 Tax=Wocania arenilitoris TaxID=2044858 RepID=A0AAE3JNG8_9FLAO|nr:response regulator [Wocania arenilitoris]MCF7567250.1 ATP-binding protein [Wocania arenilitoris]
MKINLLLCFLSISMLVIGQRDRGVIKEIDNLNTSALKYYHNNQIAESFNKFTRAKVLSDSIQDTYGTAVTNYNLGNIYSLVQNNESAKNCYNLALESSKKIEDYYLISKTYLGLGQLYKSKGEFAKATFYLEEALNDKNIENYYFFDKIEERELQLTLLKIKINLAEVFLDTNKIDNALITLFSVKDELDNENVGSYTKGYFNYVFGLYLYYKGHQNNAILRFQNTISLLENNQQNSSLLLLSNTYKQLSNIHFDLGNSDEAYLNLLLHNDYKNDYLEKEKINQDIILKSKFLIADYKFNADFANYKRLQQIEMTNKTSKINVIVTIMLFLLFITSVTLIVSYISKRKLSNVLKTKNKELEIAKDKALKTSELKSKFISSVSHELRTPLYGVVGIASLLLDEKKDFNSREVKYLKSLKYSGDYLLNLVNDILQVNKIEAQKIELKNVSVNLKSLVEHIVDSFEYRLLETNNRIIVSMDNSIPEDIKCDKVRLSQVLINLIGNSIKFTESGIINLRIKLLKLDANNVDLRFEVEDCGKGIPKEKFKTIFDNFSQLGNENNTKYQGTGLGLSITKNIIELFDSEIELESEIGVGTKFSFNITFEIDKSKKTALNLNDNGSILNLNKDKKYNILIAEDNKINQIVTKNLLIKQNYNCDLVDNGLEAVNRLKIKDFDLVLMDINMPVMNGNKATKIIREFNKTLPIIALTASDIENFKQDYKNTGFNDVITKPFDNHEFFQIIESHIQKAKEKDIEFVFAS